MMRRLLLLIAVAFLGACGSPTSPWSPDGIAVEREPVSTGAEKATGEEMQQQFPFNRILCFGDSLTYGTTLRAPEGWAALAAVEGYVPKLRRLLNGEYGEGIQLINSGVGGETSTEGLERLKRELGLYRPELVLILEGAVDIGGTSPRYVRVRRNLRNMMIEVQSDGIAAIIGTVPPFHPDGFRASGIANVPMLNQIIREEAALLGVPVADHERAFGEHPGLQGPDGVHPNDNGYLVMAETWFQEIKNLLAADRP